MPIILRTLIMVVAVSLFWTSGAVAQAGSSLAGRNDAKAEAQATAKGLVAKGFTIRGDSWSGEAFKGSDVGVRHHLFKGNEYVFVLGSDLPAKMEFRVLTSNRKPVPSEVIIDGKTATVRLNPPKTGTYLIVFSLKSAEEDRIPWALVYGYR